MTEKQEHLLQLFRELEVICVMAVSGVKKLPM